MVSIKDREWVNKNGSISKKKQLSYKDKDGIWKKKHFKTKYEAQAWYENYIKESTKPFSDDNNIIFIDAASDFIDKHAKIYCKESTKVFYNSILNQHVIPFLGHLPVAKIKHSLINGFIQKKINEGYAPKTINHMLTTIEVVYNYLIRNEIVADNPMSKIKRLKLEYNEMSFLNKLEIQDLLELCKVTRPKLYPILVTALFTGLRQGEVLALTWDDILFDRKKININKSIHRGTVTTPKTEKSIRMVDMSQIVIKTLMSHKMGCIQNENNIVFSNESGNYLSPDNLRNRHFKPLMDLFGIPNLRFHDLRHTYAALLISENIPIKYIQSQLGHSSIDVTLDTYGHLLPDVHENAVKVLDNILTNEKPKSYKSQSRYL